MTYFETEDGKTVLDFAMEQEEAPRKGKSKGQTPSVPASPQAVSHLSVDLDFYQQKAEKLSRENSQQRSQLKSMEERLRAMEERMELQERELRHAAVDLNATPPR
jgi:DNA repair exonuclease SbcCD ATPase subunit